MYQFLTLCRGCTLYPQVVIPFQLGLYRPDLHYRGEWPGIHYVAFTKTPLVHSCSLGFASRTNAVHPPRWVTNKTKSNEPLHPPPLGRASTTPWPPLTALRQSQLHPKIQLINQLRASHSTLMVALLSQVVTPRTGPYREVLRKNGLSPLEYHNIIIGITSSYHK
jgi:hypothetical protein